MSAAQKDGLPRLLRRENPGAGLRRVVQRCLKLACDDRAQTPDDAVVHRARQALKRTRAVLRLGEHLGQPHLRVKRRRLAALARKLSPLRDAAVIAHVATKLETGVGGEIGSALVELQLMEFSPPNTAEWKVWRRRLMAETRALDRLRWESPTVAELEEALARSVRRVCRRARKACDAGGIAMTHEWRKALIVLREQLAVVQPRLGGKIAHVHARLHELTDELGRATDLQVLRDAMERHDWPVDLSEARDRLWVLLRKKQRHALKRARKAWPALKRELRAGFE